MCTTSLSTSRSSFKHIVPTCRLGKETQLERGFSSVFNYIHTYFIRPKRAFRIKDTLINGCPEKSNMHLKKNLT